MPNPANTPSDDSSKATPEKRSLLIEQLEERALFDAVPIAPVDANTVEIDPTAYLETVVNSISSDGQTATTQEQEESPEVLFVDKTVDGFESLVAEFVEGRDVDVFFINEGSAGLTQIADHLDGRSNIDAIHIISHGNAGQLNLGNSVIGQEDLAGQFSSELIRIGQSLSDSGDILIYGCDLASNHEGESFIEELSSLTNADVAASDDLTGAASEGGDWVLEKSVGEIETAALSSSTYTGTLLETDDGFVVGTEPFSNINEIAVTPVSQGGVSSRLYEDTATANSGAITIDLRLTLVDTFDENGNVTTGTADQLPVTFSDFAGGPIILARNVGSSVAGFEGHTAHIQVDFFDGNTGAPLSVVGDFTFRDIDFIAPGGADSGTGSEAVTAVSDQISAYQLSSNPTTSITAEDNNDGTTTFINNVNSGGPNDQDRWVGIRFHSLDTLNLTFQARNANTGYGLSTANFSATPISFSQPVAEDDNFTTDQNTTISGNVVTADNGNGADSDPDNDQLNVYLVNGVPGNVSTPTTGSTGGQFTINPNGSYTFDPNGDFDYLAPGQTATTTIEYSVQDATGLAATATVTVVVEGLNDPPVPVGTIPDQSDFDNDTVAAVDTSAFFNDPDNQLTYSDGGTLPPGLSINSMTGVITGMLDNSASQSGPFSVVITAEEPSGQTATQTFTWAVANPAPTATNNQNSVTDDSISTATGNVLSDNDGSGQDSDPDADALIVNAITGGTVNGTTTGSYGSVVINADGSYTYNLDVTNADVEALDNNETLTDTFEYQISDGEGGTDTATLAITINGSNDAPVVGGTIPPQTDADADSITGVDVSSFFSDPEGDTLTYTTAGLPAGLTINTTTGVISGTVDNSASQNNGGVHTVSVTATDDNGDDVTATFTWTITNPGPVAVNDNNSTTQLANVSANVITGSDSDPDGDAITVNEINGSATNLGSTVAGSNGGEFTINADGSYDFDPNGDFDSLADGQTATTSVTYQITDSEGGTDTATLTITISGTNDAPTTVNTIPDQTDVDGSAITAVDVSPFFDDVDVGDSLSFAAAGLPAGLSINSSTGEITGTVDSSASQSGPYSVTVTATDDNGQSVDQTFTWNVTNPGPTAVNDNGSTDQDTNTTGDVVSNDSDADGDTITVVQVEGAPANVGSVVAGSNGGTFTVQPNGSYVFNPNGDFDSLGQNDTASTQITYQISDGEGGTDTATLTIEVTGTNQAPTSIGSIPDQANLDNDSISTLDVSPFFSDSDSSDTLTYTANGLPAGLSIDTTTGQITGTIDNSASQDGTGGVHSVTVFATDDFGAQITSTFTWTVTNPGPVAVDDTNATTQSNIVSANVTSNDSDPDGDTTTVNLVNGQAANVGSSVAGSSGGQFVVNPNGSYSFDPSSDFDYLANGETATTSVTYQITDNEGGTDSATLTITVTGTNDAPTNVGTIPDQTDVDSETGISVPTASFFADTDTNDTHTYSVAGLPAGLSINQTTGEITGTIDNSASVSGPYSVDVTIDDGNGGTSTQTFNWIITNPQPIAVNDLNGTTTENTVTTGDALTNDSDPDGDALVINGVGNPLGVSPSAVGVPFSGIGGGEFVVNADGSFTFDPLNDFDHLAAGETADSFVNYRISDGEGGTDIAAILITVTGVNDAPAQVNSIPDQTNVDSDTISAIDVTSFFSDADTADTLTYTAAGLPSGLSISTTGQITGTLDNSASQAGPYSVTITADDGNGGTVDQTFTWNVSNPGPVAVNDSDSVDQNTTTSGDVLSNDSDPDLDTITVTNVDGSASNVGSTIAGSNGGQFLVNTDGSFTFDPNGDFDSLAETETATTQITYEISDGEGGTDSAVLAITVTGTNDLPTSTTIPDQNNVDNQTIATLDVSPFFADVDGSDGLTFSASGLPTGLSIDSSTGQITGTIDDSASQSGPFSVTIEADDGNGGTVSESFTWTVTNPAPNAFDNTGAVTHISNETNSGNVILDSGVAGTDNDPDGDNVTVSAVDGQSVVGVTHAGTYGDIVINSDGSYVYTLDTNNSDVVGLNPSQSLVETFSYTISDGEGGTASADLEITIHGANLPPVVGGTIPPQTDIDGTSATLDVSSYFSDPEGGTLTYSATDLPTGLSINPMTGEITGTIEPGASHDVTNGIYNVSVTATDPNNATVSTTFDWTISNPAPLAENDTFTTDEDTTLNASVVGNDSDPDGDSVSFNQLTTASNGTATLDASGSFTYTPKANFFGTDTFDYEIVDADGDSATATVTIKVDPVNDAPTVATPIPDQANLDSESISLDVSGNYADIDDGSLTFSATGLPTGLSIDSAGLITGTIDSSASQSGPFTVVVTAEDGSGATVTDTFTWTVTNPAPTADDDNFTTTEDTPISGTVSGNDSDPDSDSVTFNQLTNPSNGTVVFDVDGSFEYTPANNFNGTDSFDYEIVDADGATSTATVTIAVDPANDPPVVDTNIPDQTNLDSQTINIDVSSNFSDVDGNPLTFTATGLPSGLSIDSAGVISGTIDSSASQSGPFTVVVTADDGMGGTVTDTFTWTVNNPAPTATNDSFATNEDTPLSNSVSPNDSDADSDSLSFNQLTNPSNGNVVFNNDGSFTYTPNADFAGTDTFDYEVVDADGAVATATVTIDITPINDAPVVATPIPDQSSVDSENISLDVSNNYTDVDTANLTFSATGLPPGLSIDSAGLITGAIDSSGSQPGTYTVVVTADDGTDTVTDTFTWTVTNPAPDAVNDSFTTSEDTPVSGDASTNDSDPDSDTLTFNQLTNPSNGTVAFNNDGTFTYLPASNFSGVDTFDYEAVDADGTSTTATVTITVGEVNDPPAVVTPIPDQADVDSTTISLDVSGNFGDLDNDSLTFSATGLPTGLSIDSAGLISGTIDSSASQNGPYTVVVTADDGNGGQGTDTFNWTITNPAPVAMNDSFTTNEDTPITGTVIGNDSDPDGDSTSFNQLTGANNGTATMASDGSFTYTPNADFFGTDTFDYEIVDADGSTSMATVTITVTPINDAPVVATPIPDQANLDSETISLDVSGNYADIDDGSLTFSATGLPTGLSIDSAGLISGTVDSSASQSGPFTVVVTAQDASGATVTDTFTWTVDNPAPTAVDDNFTTSEDTLVSGTVSGNDSDSDSDSVTFNQLTNPANGTVVFNNDGTFEYTPASNFNGTDSFDYQIVDADGATSPATVTITVDPVNDPPVVSANIADQANLDSDTITLDVGPNFSDVDGNPLTFTATGLPTGLSIDSAGVITGTIDSSASQIGPFTVVVTADDGNGGTVTDTFTWTVTNPAPIANNDSFTTNEDVAVSGAVAGNDSDSDNDTFVFNQLTNPGSGTVVFNNDGTFTYTPDANFAGTDSFDYEIVDVDGAVSSATVDITIDPVNDAPVVVSPIPDQANEDSDVISLDVSGNYSDVDNANLSFTATGLPTGLSIDSMGNITGTIDSSASQSGPFTVTVTADDGSGRMVTDTFTWTVTNPAPMAANDLFTISEDTVLNASVVGNDSDSDGDSVIYTQLTNPGNGNVTLNSDGSFDYTPDTNFAGIDAFDYQVVDADGAIATATVTIDVGATNDPPTVSTPIADQANLDSDVISLDISSSFEDTDNSSLTFSATGLPTGLTIDATGTISGTIDSRASQSGPFTVTVTADDGNSGTVTDTFTWTVTNPTPTAVDDNFTTSEDTAVSGFVSGNDSDADADTLTFNQLTSPANGMVVFDSNGNFTYTPDAEFNGTDSFDYAITDADGDTSMATVTITVDPVNDPPVVDTNLTDQVNVDSDVISIDVSPNFSDIEGNPLTFSATGLPPGLSIDSSGMISGTLDPSASQSGPFTVVVTADDGNGGTVTDTFAWTVTNPAPVAVNDSYTTSEDTPVSGAVAGNDSDADGDALAFTQTTNPTNGSVVFNSDGTFTYTPNLNFNGTDTFDYQVVDADGAVSNATVTIDIEVINDVPTSSAIPDQSNEDSDVVALDVSPFFADSDGDNLAFTASGLPTGLTIDSAGNISGTVDTSASQAGPFTVTLTADDGNGGTITESFTWEFTNPGPSAVNDSVSTVEDTPVSGIAATNDSDPDSDTLTFTQLSNPANGTVVFNSDGTFDYTPDSLFNGIDSFDYQITDADGATSTATVTIVVGDVNNPPIVTTPIADQANLDAEAISLDVSSNFSDVEGNPLTYSATGLPTGLTIDSDGMITGTIDNSASQTGPFVVVVTADDGLGGAVTDTFTWTVTNPGPTASDNIATVAEDTGLTAGNVVSDNSGTGIDSDPDGDTLNVSQVDGQSTNVGVTINGDYGTIEINADGSYTYQLDANNSDVDALNIGDTLTETFNYTITDGEGGMASADLTVTINGVNDDPSTTGSIPDQLTLDADSPTLDVSPFFEDVDGSLTFSADNLPTGLSIDPATGLITGDIDGNGSTGTPSGIYPVTVTVTDDNGATVSSTFNWTVTNPAPIAADDAFSTLEDTPISSSVVSNDSDPDNDLLDFSLINGPANGTLAFNPDGSFTYVPDADFNGTDSFDYLLTDQDGDSSAATVTLTVDSDNDAPVAVDDNFATTENTPLSDSVAPNDSDVDGDPLLFNLLSNGPTNGMISFNPDGTFDYIPDSGFNGVDSFDYEITDPDGATSVATAIISVSPVNDAPVVSTPVGDQSSVDSEVISLDVSSSFSDQDDTDLTFSANGLPPGLSIDSNGLITGTLDSSASQAGSYVVEVIAADPDGEMVSDNFIWEVTNPGPIAQDDAASTTEDTPVVSSVTPNDADPDGDDLTFALLSNPANGNVTMLPNGTFTYTPAAEFSGTDSFTYTITDSDGSTDTATVEINVAPVNDAPVAINDSATTNEDTPVDIDILANDSDNDSSDLVSVISQAPSNGNVTVNPDGSVTYTPNANFSGTDTFEYEVCDEFGTCDTAVVNVVVSPANDAPVAVNDNFSVTEDTPLMGSVVSNDSDPDNDPLTYSLISQPVGMLAFNPDGSFTFVPPADFVGTTTFDYQTQDPGGATDVATVTINVTPVNDGPTAVDDSTTTDEDNTVVVPLLANDVDPDNDNIMVTEINGVAVSPGETVTLQSGATVTLNPDGTSTYNPNGQFEDLQPDQAAFDTFLYTIVDADGESSVAESVIVINGENDVPVSEDDFVETTMDTAVMINVLNNDRDIDGEPLAVILLNQPQNGSAVVTPDGNILFTPDEGFEGTTAIHYLIEDPNGSTSDSTVTINVEPQFQFDSFTNFSQSNFARGTDFQEPTSRRVMSQKIFALAPEPIFSGYARPGTQVVGRIYDSSGALVGEASANVDPGGNWMMQFQNAKGHEFYRIEFENVSNGAAADVYGYLGLNPADNSYQSMSPMTAYDRPLSVEGAMETSKDALDSSHRHNSRPLGFNER